MISLFGQKKKRFSPALIKILLEHTTCLSFHSSIKLSILTTVKPVVHKLFIIIVENYVPNHFIACSVQFTCVLFFFLVVCLHPGVSCVASTPCQYPCLPALRDTLAKTYTQHRAAGRRQLCSLKGKVNSCACDSWSSHDIPPPNIRDSFGHNFESAERVHSQPQTKRQDLARNQAKLRFFFFFPKRISSDNVRSNEFLLAPHLV